jgi:RNA polymerase sigma factor (sigma-70 family)
MRTSTASPSSREAFLGHLDDIRLWCLARIRDSHLAEDVAQETALAALTRLDSLRDPERLRGWMFRVAQRRLADEARRRRHEVPICEEMLRTSVTDPAVCREAGEPPRARLSLKKLPAFLRRPVNRHYIEGRPVRGGAAQLATTVNAVKARLYRARRILRGCARR